MTIKDEILPLLAVIAILAGSFCAGIILCADLTLF